MKSGRLFQHRNGFVVIASILKNLTQTAGRPCNQRMVRGQVAFTHVETIAHQFLRFVVLSLGIAKQPKSNHALSHHIMIGTKDLFPLIERGP